MGLILCVLLVEQAGGAEVWSVVPAKSPLDELDTAPSSRWGSDPVVLSLHTEQTGGGKKARKWHRERNKTGKIVPVGARSGCDAHKYGDHAEVVVLGSADVGPCPQISAFQQAIKQ